MDNDFMERTLQQARELQKKLAEAAAKSQEQMQPYLEDAMKRAKTMQTTIAEHARESADLTHVQASKALDTMQDAIVSSAKAMKSGTAAATPHVQSFLDRAYKAAGEVVKSFDKKEN